MGHDRDKKRITFLHRKLIGIVYLGKLGTDGG